MSLVGGGICILGLYFSGTGNTKHCVETFVHCYDRSGIAISIEEPDALDYLSEHEIIVFGYPVYYSNMPKVVSDFIAVHGVRFRGKQVIVLATMAMWSGDGAGCAARALKAHGAQVIGGLHIAMPDNIGDEKVLKKSGEAKRLMVQQAENKIRLAVLRLKHRRPPQDGLSIWHQILGLLGQRLWFSGRTNSYQEKPSIDNRRCNGCGRCVELCPIGNLDVKNGKAQSNGKCTLCYRCFSHCPRKAITILGKTVHEQYLFENVVK